MEHMTEYLTPSAAMPCYMVFPRFLPDSGLSETAMLLYVLLLDRARLSMSNPQWTDEAGHVFLRYPIRELAEALHKSEMTVKSSLRSLERQGLIVRKRRGVGQPNQIYVMLPTDRKSSVRETENCPSDRKKAVCQADRKLSTNNNYRVKTQEKEQMSKSHACGKYKNIFLTPEELSELRQTVPDCDGYIERLSSYMASTGKTYRNHAATIRSWALRDKPAASARSYDCKEDESL